MISYSAFGAGLRSRYERAYFPSLNLFGRAAKAGLPSFLTERASSFAPSNRLCQQQALSCDSDNLENRCSLIDDECPRDLALRGINPESGRNEVGVLTATVKSGSHRPSENNDGVAARSPGKASSYLYAMKGEARRRRLKCLAPYGIRADPHRESYRFLHRNK